MSCNVATGPTLAEEEMLHDGEPVFAMAWSETGGTEKAVALSTEDRRPSSGRTETDLKHKSSGHPVGVKVRE